MKNFTKTLAVAAVATVSSLFAQEANAQFPYGIGEASMIEASEMAAVSAMDLPTVDRRTVEDCFFDNKQMMEQNKAQIEAISAEVKELLKGRKIQVLTDSETRYYTPILRDLGCGFLTTAKILFGKY